MLNVIVRGNSMEPKYPDGSVVCVGFEPVIKPGMVVAFRHNSDGLMMLKRVVDVVDDHLYVLSDNRSSGVDSRVFGWIKIADVVGVVQG